MNAALADGVPLVCLPDGRDQPDNAARVTAAGAGIALSRTASADELRDGITQALSSPALKRGAAAMQAALSKRDGAATVAEAVARVGAEPATVRGFAA